MLVGFKKYNNNNRSLQILESRRAYLVAVDASGLESLGVMAAAVDVDVAVEVDEVDKQFEADDADEAGRVPGGVGAGATGKHRQLAGDQRLPALPPAHAPVMNSTLRPRPPVLPPGKLL